MKLTKLTVDTLDNEVKSAVINIGANNGYIEAFINVDEVCILVHGKHGDIISQQFILLKTLRDKNACEIRAQQIDEASWVA
jgi:uncharacterized protein YheU (UPF0270 family)